MKLRSLAEVPEEVRLGSPKKGRAFLVLQSSKGATLVQGDTHAIWKSHQTDAKVLGLFEALGKGQSCKVEIVKVELGGSAFEEVEVDI